jgi:hypothetical protein
MLYVKTKGKMQDSQEKETSTDEEQGTRENKKIFPMGSLKFFSSDISEFNSLGVQSACTRSEYQRLLWG